MIEKNENRKKSPLDFPGGSAAGLRGSIHKMFALEGDFTVYPGHDEPTSLDYERRYNPFR